MTQTHSHMLSFIRPGKMLFLLLCSIITLSALGQSIDQPLPQETFVQHYRIDIGYNTTTVLIFPAPIKPAPGETKVPLDRGTDSFIAQKQAGVENVIKLKANHKGFTPTNLHVFTTDGKVYGFNIYYTDLPLATTYDLTKLNQVGYPGGLTLNARILLTGKAINDCDMAAYIREIKHARPRFSRHTQAHQMRLKLRTIHRANGLIFLGFDIANYSNLDYPIDFIRLYIADQKRIKRSSTQENDLTPVYKDTSSSIPGHTHIRYVVAVPSFTIPDAKQFHIQVYEANGGRNLELTVKNRELLNAQPL